MTADATLYTKRRPDLPGKAPGVVGVRMGTRHLLYTLQCEQCFTTEEPEHLVLMTIHFHARSRDGANPRLCRDCRLAANPGCICDGCRDDAISQRRERAQ
ncbi:hypothetical protein J2S94_003280 [Arthrobacter bambusae]|nr:hypothetical protein [Arthrobacter bambusae]